MTDIYGRHPGSTGPWLSCAVSQEHPADGNSLLQPRLFVTLKGLKRLLNNAYNGGLGLCSSVSVRSMRASQVCWRITELFGGFFIFLTLSFFQRFFLPIKTTVSPTVAMQRLLSSISSLRELRKGILPAPSNTWQMDSKKNRRNYFHMAQSNVKQFLINNIFTIIKLLPNLPEDTNLSATSISNLIFHCFDSQKKEKKSYTHNWSI